MQITALILCLILTISCGTTIVPEPDTNPPDSVKTDDTLRFTSFLDEMTSSDGITRFPDISYTCRQASSYDRRSKTPKTADWFANDDGWGYERIEFNGGRTEKVIFDEKHPGVITRIWLTSFNSPKTIIRFYFDGGTAPSHEMKSFDLQQFTADHQVSIGNGLVFPGKTWIRGSVLYLPIPYSKSCKITIEEQEDDINASRYYHINFRQYPDDIHIETFSDDILRKNILKINQVSSYLLAPSATGNNSDTVATTIKAGETFTVGLPGGSKAVTELTCEVETAGNTSWPDLIRNIIVDGIFDGHKTLSLPLTELSGAGRGANYVSSFRFESNGKGRQTAIWMMPYKEKASLTFGNFSDKEISVTIITHTTDYAWDGRSLYLHAGHRLQEATPIRLWNDYSNGYEWNFATISGGRGVYAGDVYTINNKTHQWPGEGDEKIWVDDELFPSHFGTGVEDYFSFCGYFRFHTPFSGEPRLDRTDFHGYNIHYRIRLLDAIPFNDNIVFNLEMEGHEAGYADVESTVFWYGDPETKLSDSVKY